MAKEDAILVVNAGSSSLKFQLFAIRNGDLQRLNRGQIDGIGVRPRLRIADAQGRMVSDQKWAADQMSDLPTAISHMREWLREMESVRLRAIGHRVVHGGPDHADPVRMRPETLEELARYQELAPLHQPNNLAPIRLAMQIAPHLPQIACFDTAFHRGHAPHTDCYALPRAFYESGIRRYGFHGLSYEYIAQRLPVLAPEIAKGRVIVAHLGSGASMCALKDGRSIDTTMGFSALDGVPMGTRPGQLDPGVVIYLMSHMGMSADEVTDLLYNRSGLLGLSGLSSDMRELLKDDSHAARFAVRHFVHRCGLHIGMMAAALEGVDGFVFTAGIGENSPLIRECIAQKLAWLGGEMVSEANAANALRISAPASRIGIYVMPTDEEFVIATETLALLERHGRN